MTVELLIGRLRDCGAALVLDGGDLRCKGPGEVLTPEVLDALRTHKAAIVAALEAECRGTPGPCVRCGRVAWAEYGAELAAGSLVCGDCLSPADVAAGSVPVACGGAL